MSTRDKFTNLEELLELYIFFQNQFSRYQSPDSRQVSLSNYNIHPANSSDFNSNKVNISNILLDISYGHIKFK